MNTPRDILDGVWEDMHTDPEFARAIREAVCQWAGCDDALIEQGGGVWVSGDPRLISEGEAAALVDYLQRAGLVGAES